MRALRNVTVLAATNRPDVIDAALLRPGRMDRMIYIPPPDADARKHIFAIHLARMPHAADIDVHALVAMTEGFSGAEVASVCRNAALLCMRDCDGDDAEVTGAHMAKACAGVSPQISQSMLDFYAEFGRRFKARVIK